MLVKSPQAEAEVCRTVFGNGLTVVSEHMPGVRSVAFGAWVRAASIHEPRDRMGVSHMLEHMVFKGTSRRSAKEIALSLEALGGSLDAYTSREHTVFQARVLDEHLPQAADVIADLIFRPALRAEDLRLERRVILEEISMVDDTPDDLVFELHNAELWGEHPYGYSILGTRDTVSALGTKDLQALHQRAYHPPQIVVAAAGNIDHDALVETLHRTGWGDIDRGDPTPLTSNVPEPLAAHRTHVEREGAQTHIVYGSRAIPHADDRRYALGLVSTLLGGGMSSRLFQRIREDLGLAYAVSTFQSLHVDAGVHGVYVATGPETTAEAMEAIEAELADVCASGLPEDEIESGKQQLRGQITLSMESVSSRMYRAASPELYGEPFRTLDEVLDRVQRITPDEVRSVCAEFFAPEAQTVVSLGPAGS